MDKRSLNEFSYLLVDGSWIVRVTALVNAAGRRHPMVGGVQPVLVVLVAAAVELEEKPALLVRTNIQMRQKQTPWSVVRKRTISTERPPLVCKVLFLALPDFLRSSVSGTGFTQPREDN
jgi:hypothetical protein